MSEQLKVEGSAGKERPVKATAKGDAERKRILLSDHVGGRLKLLRHSYGISQRELARRANITNGTLSNIEQGKVSPSVASLEKILNALPISLQEFFSEQIDPVPVIYRADQMVHIRKDDTECQILPLAQIDSGAYLAYRSFSPGAKVRSEWMVSEGYIGGIVLEGELQMHLEGVDYTLVKGEGFHFALQRNHVFANISDEPCVVVSASFSTEKRSAADKFSF